MDGLWGHHMTAETENVFGLIERESSTGRFVRKIVGFPHIEFSGHGLAEVEAKLQEAALDYAASEVLIVETEFVALVRLDATATGTESASLPLSKEPAQRDTPARAASAETGNVAVDLDARLRPMLNAFRPNVHGGEYGHVAPPITGKIKTFGPVGPPYDVGRPVRQLDNGDWLFEVTMVETGSWPSTDWGASSTIQTRADA